MPPRKRFALVYTDDPPAVDVVREDFVTGPFTAGASITFPWTKKAKDEIIELEGTILHIGMRKDMLNYKIGQDGVPVAEGEQGLGTRKQEIEARRLQQQQTKEANLQIIAENVVAGGPGAVVNIPVVKKNVNRLPRKRSLATLMALQDAIDNLPCWRGGDCKTELVPLTKIYMDAGKISFLKRHLKDKPARLFRSVVRILCTTKLLLMDGISATGTRGCKKLPSQVVETALRFVINVCTPERTTFDPVQQVRHLISNLKKREKKSAAALAQADPQGGGPAPPLGGEAVPLGGGPAPPLGGEAVPLGGGPAPPLGGEAVPQGGGPAPPLGAEAGPQGGAYAVDQPDFIVTETPPYDTFHNAPSRPTTPLLTISHQHPQTPVGPMARNVLTAVSPATADHSYFMLQHDIRGTQTSDVLDISYRPRSHDNLAGMQEEVIPW